MENKQALKAELSAYQDNFRYITESGLLYPNIDLKRRKRLVQIYNQVFGKSEQISTTCRSCMKLYVKELADWYYAEAKKDTKQNEKEAAKQSAKEAANQSAKETAKQSAKEAAKQSPKEVPTRAVKETPKPAAATETEAQPQPKKRARKPTDKETL